MNSILVLKLVIDTHKKSTSAYQLQFSTAIKPNFYVDLITCIVEFSRLGRGHLSQHLSMQGASGNHAVGFRPQRHEQNGHQPHREALRHK